MSVVLMSIVPAFAAEDEVTVDKIIAKYNIQYDSSAYPYYVLIRKLDSSYSEYFCLVLSDKANAVDVKNGFAFADSGIIYSCFVSQGSYICNTLKADSNSSLGRLNELNFLSSNYDVKYEGRDDVFFQQPTLLVQLLSLVPQGVGAKIAEDSLTLTICGISLLALLVGCSLVPKVLYRFL